MNFFRYEKKFIKQISKIKDPVVFFGLAKIFNVSTMVDKDTPREFNDVLEDIINAYFAAAPSRQREILKILKDANECKESIGNGNYTKASAETVSDKEV